MSNTVIRPKDRAEWLEYRKDGIGSSEVATIPASFEPSGVPTTNRL